MNRREFLASATAGLVLAHTTRSEPVATASAKLARVSIMSFNFSSRLKLPGQPDSPDRTLEVLDIPEMLADRYHVHNIELQNAHVPMTDASYLKELRAKAKKAKSRITQINLEFGRSNFSADNEADRNQAVTLSKEWIDHAAALGAGRVMLNQGRLTAENKEYSIPTLKSIGDYGKSKGVRVAMETRAPAPNGRAAGRGRGRGRGPGPGAGAAGAVAPPAPVAPAPDAPPLVLPPAPAWANDDATNAAWRQANPFVMPPPNQHTEPSAPSAWDPPEGVNGLLVENVKASGTYINIDVGGMGVDTQDEMETHLREIMPLDSGQMHINWRDNPGWDMPQTLRFTRQLGFQGLYVIEVAGATDPYLVTQGLLEVILANV